MAKVRIKRRLSMRYYYYIINSLVVSLLAFALLWKFALLVIAACALTLSRAVWFLRNVDNHPDLVLLSRYGSLSKLVPAIEAELVDPNQVSRVGRIWQPFGIRQELGGYEGHAEVWFTPSWLIYVTAEGYRMQFFQLDSIVLAARIGNMVRLVDRYYTRLEIPGTEAGITRLLAEILTRVPWALNHFDAETEKTWTENRQQIIAQVEQRREQFKLPSPDASEPPGQARRSGVQGPPG